MKSRPKGTPILVCDCSSRGTPLIVKQKSGNVRIFIVLGNDVHDEELKRYGDTLLPLLLRDELRLTGYCPICKRWIDIQTEGVGSIVRDLEQRPHTVKIVTPHVHLWSEWSSLRAANGGQRDKREQNDG